MTTGYQIVYNEKTNKFEYKEFETKMIFGLMADIPTTNVYEYSNGHGYYSSKEDAEIEVNDRNQALKNGSIRVLKCKDCGLYFMMQDEEIKWFKDMKFQLPKRCKDCRGKKSSMQVNV